jgi:hypothetical protein
MSAFHPLAPGITQIGLVTPPGFTTPAALGQISATVVQPAILVGGGTVGKDLQGVLVGILGAPAPAGGLTVTITSADSSKVLLSTAPTSVGSASIEVLVNPATTLVPAFHVQALDETGTVELTASAPGFASGSSTVSLVPSGFIINSPSSISTTTLSSDTTVVVASTRLDPATHASAGAQPIRAGLSVDVELTSSDPSVGAITVSPLTFGPNQGSRMSAFHPLAPGITQIGLVTPPGFTTPAALGQISATVVP